jgi:hypothetical protein
LSIAELKTTLGGRDKERSVKTSLVAIFSTVPGRSEPPAPNKECEVLRCRTQEVCK